MSMALAGEGPEAMEADFSHVSEAAVFHCVIPQSHPPRRAHTTAITKKRCPTPSQGQRQAGWDGRPCKYCLGVRVMPGLAPSEDVGRESVVWSGCSLGWSKLQQIIN